MAKRSKNFQQRKVEPTHRINENIRVPKIRLVGDLEKLSEIVGRTLEPGIFNTKEALNFAYDAELDLVEISPNADPPVAKIIDYRKFLYEKKKKEKEIKSKAVKTVNKEIRFGPNTDDHDFNFKLKHAVKFLEAGAKVKAYVQFRGRSIVFKERGELLLLRFLKELDEYGAAEALPKMEGRRMFVIIAPKKVAKKVAKKKAPKKKKEADVAGKKTEAPAKKETDVAGKKTEETTAGKKIEAPEKKVEIAEKKTETPEKKVETAEKKTEAPAKKEADVAEKKTEAPEKKVETAEKKTEAPAKKNPEGAEENKKPTE